MQHDFFLNQSQGHCWAEVTLIIFPLVGFHEKDVKMACLWKSTGRGCELIMSNLVKASWVWEVIISKAWQHLCPLQEEPICLTRQQRQEASLTPDGLNWVDCTEQRSFTLISYLVRSSGVEQPMRSLSLFSSLDRAASILSVTWAAI